MDVVYIQYPIFENISDAMTMKELNKMTKVISFHLNTIYDI